MRQLILLAALLLPAMGAQAAERKLFLGSFERLRVEGPFEVTVATGRSPGGTVTGERDAIDGLEVRQDGATLVVRSPFDRWQERARPVSTGPVRVTLATPVLSAASVMGGGAVAIAGGSAGSRSPRLDLSVTGAGGIALTGANTDAATAQVIGTGKIVLAGRATRARLLVNGAGRIEADALDAGELTVRVDGPGEAIARARYTATVTNTGLGRVAVAGTAKCLVKSDAGGPVTCGAGSAR